MCINIIDSENNMVVLKNIDNGEDGLDTNNEDIEVGTEDGEVVVDTLVEKTMTECEIKQSFFTILKVVYFKIF